MKNRFKLGKIECLLNIANVCVCTHVYMCIECFTDEWSL